MLKKVLPPGWAAQDATVYEVLQAFADQPVGVNILVLIEILEYPDEKEEEILRLELWENNTVTGHV